MKLSAKVSLNILQWIALIFVFLTGFGIRLFDLKDAPLDFHPVRQLRSALIARSVYYQLSPAFSPEQRQLAAQLADLEVYEPPILENIIGLTYTIVGSEQIWISRIYNAVFWLAGGLALFLLSRRYTTFAASLLGLAFYLFLPFGIIASRSFQPEPWMVMWILWTCWALDRWANTKQWKWALLAGILGGIAVLVKVVAGLFVVAVLGILTLSFIGIKKAFRTWQPWLMATMMIVPTLVYYLIFQSQRSSGFLSFWVGSLSWMILQTGFYADWLAMVKGLMGLGFLLIAVLGTLAAPKPLKAILSGLWLGYIFYGLIFPYQYSTHEYYHLPLVGLVGLGLVSVGESLVMRLKEQVVFWKLAAVAVLLFASFYAVYVTRSVLVASDYTYEPASWQRVGEAMPPDSSIIALTADYGMRLRYYGWQISTTWPDQGDIRLRRLSNSQEIDYQTTFSELTAGKGLFCRYGIF